MKFKQTLFFLFVTFLGFSQQTEYVDFKTAKADIVFGDLTQKEVSGIISYEFEVLKDVDSVFVDANNFDEIRYRLDGQFEDSLYNGKQLIIKHPFIANSKYKVEVVWKTRPKKALYFIDWLNTSANSGQVWTQGQGKYTSNWLPSIDDMNDKIEFDLNITFDKDYDAIANGKLTNKQTNDSTITWSYDMQAPMSSYLVALVIGQYGKKVEYSKSGIPLEMYYYPDDSLKFEPTYRYTKQMFDFLEEEIGVPYPWQNYKMVPVKDFLYAGMENTSLNIYSDASVIDSIAFIDRNFVNINAHELAHQWFGDLVTETSGTHHWLQEGFATYYALLAERNIYGNDYYYWQLYEYAQELLEQDKVGGSTSLLNPKSSSTTFYKKGAWVLHMLRERIGDEAFKKGVKNYLLNHQFKNVETNDFISEVEKASGESLDDFVKYWLENEDYLYEDCIESLKQHSKEISRMFELDQELMFSSHSLEYSVTRYWDKATSSKIKAHLFSKAEINIMHDSVFRKALNSNDIKVRQVIAKSLNKIPSELKTDYESLLNDKSYVTIEVALFNLWNNFPEDRNKYLNKTKGIYGFNDKNIHILWLTLALLTDDFEPENQAIYFKELTDYTSPKYDYSIRQNAFQYLLWISSCAENCEENLKQATTHHYWQFSKYAKEMLKNR
ncbi:M1 family metallopeptidase [Thalassobellus suaedae]|uniref:Aminopeptidase N n=1 Tax=Thalassobellus suaedae TaxID=3074124 RepID=A0ABY9Y220_9FLAO|nr:M1 family metallopeptidase [Flavobacteriaceae bacterium HL-DH10]